MSENIINTQSAEYTPRDLTSATSEEVAQEIAKILWTKKAKGIKILKVRDKTVLTDYFVICNGNSSTQLKGLAGEVEYQMGFCGIKPYGMEGYAEASWILIDYTSVIVHIFNRDTRDFYKLEKLWSEAEEVDISSLLPEDIQ
ncbi:MAG: ribosome silencing factor [Clostridia bacterium]|nr:ribosome silencing factor [Clostridia bacterium]